VRFGRASTNFPDAIGIARLRAGLPRLGHPPVAAATAY
jgi:hypothetical protein